jgi:predicted NUDIX family phosphoesterase
MNAQVTSTQPTVSHHDEHILVVKRDTLFPDGAWQGLRAVTFEEYIPLIEQHKEFLPRSVMETDPKYKQIIPYLIFTHKDKYFLMQRQAKASEQRLKNKYSLGIGGHIREEDITSKSIIEWAQREFEEEVSYQGSYNVRPLGILNDDSNPVGQVHVGFVLLLEGNSPAIKVKSELKSGELLSFKECDSYYENMETWSQMVLDFLRTKS